MVGYKVEDTLSLDLAGTYKATNFNFLLGYNEKGFETQDGLIGLSRTVDTSYDMFYQKLYSQGRVSSNVFSFYMADDAGDPR